MKTRTRIFKWFTGIDVDKLKADEKTLTDAKAYNAYASNACGLEDSYLFDFKNWSSQYSNSGGGTFIQPIQGYFGTGTETEEIKQKIRVKPIDVLNELETIPTPFSLTLIDEKIDILKEKSKLIVQVYAKREVDALIERLENRRKYLEFKEYFDKFQNTTDEKIDVFVNKYELVMKTSDIFIPEFPDEAIVIMKEYTEKMDAICSKKPIFYVIAEEKDFKKAYEKRDPILLVQSPFGFYWQILGAWDKEMLLLSEL